MASIGITFGSMAAGRVYKATAAKSGSGEEKRLLDWILGELQKDQLLETGPILKKVEENGAPPRKNSVAPPAKKNEGGSFGGLFAKK